MYITFEDWLKTVKKIELGKYIFLLDSEKKELKFEWQRHIGLM